MLKTNWAFSGHDQQWRGGTECNPELAVELFLLWHKPPTQWGENPKHCHYTTEIGPQAGYAATKGCQVTCCRSKATTEGTALKSHHSLSFPCRCKVAPLRNDPWQRGPLPATNCHRLLSAKAVERGRAKLRSLFRKYLWWGWPNSVFHVVQHGTKGSCPSLILIVLFGSWTATFTQIRRRQQFDNAWAMGKHVWVEPMMDQTSNRSIGCRK